MSFAIDFSTLGGIFYDYNGDMVFGFVECKDCNSSFEAKLWGIIRAIEPASQRGWTKLWLETNSFLTLLVLNNGSIVPWIDFITSLINILYFFNQLSFITIFLIFGRLLTNFITSLTKFLHFIKQFFLLKVIVHARFTIIVHVNDTVHDQCSCTIHYSRHRSPYL